VLSLEYIVARFKEPQQLMHKRDQKLLDRERVVKLKSDGETVIVVYSG
jgi:tRNA G37 N-methylase Trm5